MKKIINIISAMTLILVMAIMNTGVCCAQSLTTTFLEMSREELIEYFDLESAANKNGIDVDQLADNVYDGLRNARFSPFSDIENSDNEMDYSAEMVEEGARMVAAYDQHSTMYLETGNNCASGTYPYVGCVAVHRVSSTDRSPIIPFGTRIYYDSDSVNINGTNYESFIVEDTGAGNGRSTYWTDVYGGANTPSNYNMAINYGVRIVDISW